MGENKGPFYSFNPAYRSIELNEVCRDCPHLQHVPRGDVHHDDVDIWWAEPVCPHEVCPRLDEVKKGVKNNG